MAATHDRKLRQTLVPFPGERRRRAVTLVALSLTFALVQLDATIVNVALQTLRADLGGGVSAAQWAVDGYAVPFAVCMLTGGALGDRYGHRRICLAGFVLFGVGSAGAALAGDWAMLITARAGQGVGAALMLPTSLAMIAELYPGPGERSRALGIWGGVATIGFASGPLLGGWLITVASWPAIFWINLPAAAAIAGTIAVLGPCDRSQPRGIHPVGTALGILALACLTGAFIEAGAGRMALAGSLLALALATGAVFVAFERRGAHPLVPSALLRSAAFRWSLVAGFAFNFSMYGALLCVSLTLQDHFGLSAFAGGLAVLPMAVLVGGGAITGGRLAAAFGPRRPLVAGFALAALGSLVTGAGGLTSSPPVIIAGLAVIGLCCLAMPAMTSVALGTSPPQHTGLAGGVLNTVRQLAGALGVALLGGVLNAGGYRAGFTVALAVAAAVSAGGLLSSLAATAVAARTRG